MTSCCKPDAEKSAMKDSLSDVQNGHSAMKAGG